MATVLDVHIQDLEEAKNSAVEYVLNGSCKDFAEYKYMVGQLRGIGVAIFKARERAQQMIHEDDADE